VNPGRIAVSTRIELRCPDPSANPYLAFAGMLAAGLDGIKRGLDAPLPQEEDLYHLEEPARAELTAMPGSLGEAIVEFEQSPLFRQVLGEHLFHNYLAVKRQEWDDYRIAVSEWELDRYLAVY
jgi:glutamine synthetase